MSQTQNINRGAPRPVPSQAELFQLPRLTMSKTALLTHTHTHTHIYTHARADRQHTKRFIYLHPPSQQKGQTPSAISYQLF